MRCRACWLSAQRLARGAIAGGQAARRPALALARPRRRVVRPVRRQAPIVVPARGSRNHDLLTLLGPVLVAGAHLPLHPDRHLCEVGNLFRNPAGNVRVGLAELVPETGKEIAGTGAPLLEVCYLGTAFAL